MPCRVTQALAALPPDGQEVMGMVVDDPDYPPNTVAEAFTFYGHTITARQVGGYRKDRAEERKATWGDTREDG